MKCESGAALRDDAAGRTDSGVTSEDMARADARASGIVKWFDATRGYGFVVPEDGGGDILIHYSALNEFGRRNLPEGARVECMFVEKERGRQATEILDIDESDCGNPSIGSALGNVEGLDEELIASAGEFEPVAVKWFNRLKGYGFLISEAIDRDVFVHMEIVRHSGLLELEPGDSLQARIAHGPKGPLAVMLARVD